MLSQSIPAFWWVAPIFSSTALLIAFVLYQKLLNESEGTEKMKEIAGYVKEGAMAYLAKQNRVILVVFSIVFLILVVLSYLGIQNMFVPLIFLSGGFWSGVSGYLGMKTATNASARTASACQTSLNKGLKVAFRGGAIMGLMVVGFGLLDISVWFFLLNKIYDANLFNISSSIVKTLGMTGWDASVVSSAGYMKLKYIEITTALLPYAMGASMMALFARVGGGIYTKAADVGADLVGKVEAGIPEDDPRNPATIADNVGDNVGDVAGMGADLYESYCGSILAAMALGASLVFSQGADMNMIFTPMLVAGIGILCSLIGIFMVKTKENASQQSLLHSLLLGTGISSALIIAFLAFFATTGLISWVYLQL